MGMIAHRRNVRRIIPHSHGLARPRSCVVDMVRVNKVYASVRKDLLDRTAAFELVPPSPFMATNRI